MINVEKQKRREEIQECIRYSRDTGIYIYIYMFGFLVHCFSIAPACGLVGLNVAKRSLTATSLGPTMASCIFTA